MDDGCEHDTGRSGGFRDHASGPQLAGLGGEGEQRAVRQEYPLRVLTSRGACSRSPRLEPGQLVDYAADGSVSAPGDVSAGADDGLAAASS
jgi:hypothetical protein